MKSTEFKTLLQGVRETGAYLRELKNVESLAGSLGTGRKPVSVKRMKAGAKSAMAQEGRKGRTAAGAPVGVDLSKLGTQQQKIAQKHPPFDLAKWRGTRKDHARLRD